MSADADLPPSVVLVGPPGAGKSTIGRKLARELGVDLYDTDAGIEEQTGRTIPEIFAQDGEPEFRRIEEDVVRAAVLEGHGVISLGGGSVLSAATREVLRGRTVIYLEISVGEGLRRTGASANRPLLNGDDPAKKYRELMKARRPLYREVATIRVRTDGRSPGRVVRMILGKLGVETTMDPEDSTDSALEPASAVIEVAEPARTRSRRRRRRGRGRGDGAEDGGGTNSTGSEADSPPVQADPTTGPTSPAGPTAGDDAETAQRARRPRRARRRGRRPAGPAAESATGGLASAGADTGVQRPAQAAPGEAAASPASAPDSPAAQRDSAPTAGSDSPPGGGRSRRARARRARARARAQNTPEQPAREESEQQR